MLSTVTQVDSKVWTRWIEAINPGGALVCVTYYVRNYDVEQDD